MNLVKTAGIVLDKCMAAKPGETVLIVTDTAVDEEISKTLFNEASKRTSALLLKMEPTGEHGREPPEAVACAMRKANVVLCPTKYSLTHTQACKSASRAGARIATMPGINQEMFNRAINIDYEQMASRARKIAAKLSKAKEVGIITPSGTKLIVNVKECKVVIDPGVFDKPGDYGNLPAGEAFLAPKSGDGTVIVDSMGEVCRPRTEIIVKKGRVEDIPNNKRFKEKMWGYENARNLAEFGIGINPKAILSGDVLEEEKVLGTCHVAFGSNFGFGGKVHSEVHWDNIMLKPTVYFDEEVIMKDGVLLI